MRHHLRIVHGSPTSAELAAITAVLSAVLYGAERTAGHHRTHRAEWDRAWHPHPVPHSWCARVPRLPFHRR
ncbi:acyl-CoA carboxylase subunit epsilon [Streptomyces sp. TRM49041]|uniref:acyl-CoA carboxylase subunit epsilon n=1 Tax=Streptomyces sp. TRM49041 TaxID=2603216 RepID=UPI0011F00BF7|nr:acyl-CoA carboxylase subunit epsilon [Streptomyces sp. TRM49041]